MKTSVNFRFRFLGAALCSVACSQYSIVSAQVATAELAIEADQKSASPSTTESPANSNLLASVHEFLRLIDDSQKEQVQYPFGSPKRVQWHFVPLETRKGLPLMQMTEPQKLAAHRVLESIVSKLGYDQATAIMHLEKALRTIEAGRGRNERNPEKYYFTLFGQPGEKQRWGLSIEGHHLSLNFVMLGEKIIDSTPQFFASNPAILKSTVSEEFPAGYRILKDEQDVAFELIQTFRPEQLAKAMLPGEVPSEIQDAGQPQSSIAQSSNPQSFKTKISGIAAGELTPPQQAMLRRLLHAYTDKMRPEVAKERWKLIDDAGFEKVHIAWAGATQQGVGHYYRIQSDTFLVEFINVQPDAEGNPANHIHTVWRDLTGDFDLPNR